MICIQYGLFSFAADDSNCTFPDNAILPLYNCNTPHAPADSGFASPDAIIRTGFPLVVMVVLAIIAGNVAMVEIVLDGHMDCE